MLKLMVVCVNVFPSPSPLLPPLFVHRLSLEKRRNNVELSAGGGLWMGGMACSRQKGTRERWVLCYDTKLCTTWGVGHLGRSVCWGDDRLAAFSQFDTFWGIINV